MTTDPVLLDRGVPFPGRGRESGEQAADVDIDGGPGGSPRRVDAALNTDLDRKRTGPGWLVSAGGRLPSFRRGAVRAFAPGMSPQFPVR